MRRARGSNVQISSGTRKQLKHLLCALLHTATEQDLPHSLRTIDEYSARCISMPATRKKTYHCRCRRRARQLQVGKRAGQSRLQDPSTTFMQEKRPKAPGTDDAYVSTVEKGIAHEERTHHELQLRNLHGLLSHSGYLFLFTTRKPTTLSMNRIRSTSHRQKGLQELVAACSQRQKPWHLSLRTTGAPTSNPRTAPVESRRHDNNRDVDDLSK